MTLTKRHPFALDVSNNRIATQSQVKASGAEILICKATEGTGFVDDTLAGHRAIAKNLGIKFGSYTFLHPDSTGSEAHFYLEHAKPVKGDIVPIIDAETFSGVFKKKTGVEALALRAASCGKAILKEAGCLPMLYAGPYTWPEMVKYAPWLKRLLVWEAQYPGPTLWSRNLIHMRMRLGVGARFAMWQYTDAHMVMGEAFDFSRVYKPLSELTIK